MNRILCYSALFCFTLLCTLTMYATTHTVTITADSTSAGDGSLRSTIAAAASGDTITFSMIDTIRLDSGQILIDKDLVIIGLDTVSTVISGEGKSRIFEILPGSTVTLLTITLANGDVDQNTERHPLLGGAIYSGGTLTLDGVKIDNSTAKSTNFRPSHGGGIYSTGVLAIRDSKITNNTVNSIDSRGAGIYNGGILTMNNTMVSSNTATTAFPRTVSRGGGIYNNGSMTILSSTIANNTVNRYFGNGAGIYNAGDMMINDSRITGNAASSTDSRGGGIYNDNTLTITNSRVTNNAADTSLVGGSGNCFGGGIYNNDSMVIDKTIISDNTVSTNDFGSGGGLFNWGALTINKSTVSNNTAMASRVSGGGIEHNVNSRLTISSSVISDNTAIASSGESLGGGIRTSSTITIGNSTIAKNIARGPNSSGGGIYNSNDTLMNVSSTVVAHNEANTGPNISSIKMILSQGSNLVADATGANFVALTSDTVGSSITPVDPLFVDTMAQNYRLQPISPAIDRGSITPGVTLSADRDNRPRVIGAAADIGAYERGVDIRYSSFDLDRSRFMDPCGCDDPQNFEVGGTYYFHDVLTVTNPSADAVLLDSTYTMAFFDSTATGMVALFADRTRFTQVNDSTFVLDFWRASGTAAPTVSVLMGYDGSYISQMVTSTTFQPACDITDCLLDNEISLDRSSFMDPCSCDDSQNFQVGDTYYFHDILTVVNSFVDTVLMDSTMTTAFFDSTATGMASLFTDSTGFTRLNDSTFVLDFWRASSTTLPAASIILVSGSISTTQMVESTTFQPACDIADCLLDNEISLDRSIFMDPCSCADPQNFEVGGTYYFHDVLTVINTSADTVLLDSTLTMAFFDSTAAGMAVLFADSTGFSRVNDSTFVLDFWRASGPTSPTASVFLGAGGTYVSQVVPPMTFQPSCDVADCAASTAETIPTLSEWGIIILLLSMMSVGVVAMRSQSLVSRERLR